MQYTQHCDLCGKEMKKTEIVYHEDDQVFDHYCWLRLQREKRILEHKIKCARQAMGLDIDGLDEK